MSEKTITFEEFEKMFKQLVRIELSDMLLKKQVVTKGNLKKSLEEIGFILCTE